MKFLKFLTLIILVQVSSRLWMNPMQIVALEKNKYSNALECKTIIVFAGGGGGSQYAYECSDWDFDKVKTVLEKEHN